MDSIVARPSHHRRPFDVALGLAELVVRPLAGRVAVHAPGLTHRLTEASPLAAGDGMS